MKLDLNKLNEDLRLSLQTLKLKNSEILDLKNGIRKQKKLINSKLLSLSDVALKQVEENYQMGLIDILEATHQKANIYLELSGNLYPYEETEL